MRARLLILATAVALAGCVAMPAAEEDNAALDAEYQSAHQSLQAKQWAQASHQLEQLVEDAPHGRYQAQALLDLAYAAYQQGQTDKTREYAERFIAQYRDHAKAAYAYYMRGLALNRTAQRELEDRLAAQEPTPYPMQARRAFEAFAALVQRFPQSPYAEDSIRRMRKLRNGLARYELHRAQQQLVAGDAAGAVKRTQYVLDRYSSSEALPEALALLVRGYRALGKNEQAHEALQSLQTEYPDAPQVDALRGAPARGR